MSKLPPKKSRDVVIYEQVFDALLEQKLAPGTRLSEDKLGQLFGVSRTIIRKVLQRLEYEGVVEIHRNRGASVASATKDQVKQVFAARRTIELAVVEQACAHINEAQIETLRNIIDEEKKAVERDDKGSALRLSGELHLLLAEFCGNEVLSGFARSLISRCSLIIAQYGTTPSKLCSIDEHFELIDAIAANAPTKAMHLMEVHIKHIQARIHFSENTSNPNLSDIFTKDINQNDDKS